MNGKTTALVIILVLLGIAGGYYLGTNYKFTLQPQNAVSDIAAPTLTPTPTQTPEPQATVSAQPVDDNTALLSAVKAGLVAEHGPDAANLVLSIGKINGNFAEGGAAETGGGGMWLAAKVNGVWHLAWDGNGTIGCSSVNPYNFPITMIPQCWDDAAQKMITR